MITSEREHEITRAQLARFLSTLEGLEKSPPEGVAPRLLQLQKDALQSQADDLREEIVAYENLSR